MDPRRLLIFRTVAHAGSIGAAARGLGWTQPAVSQHMSALEREVGHPLLLRRHNGVILTEAGQWLLAHADTVAATLSMAEKEQADLGRLASGTVRIAAFPSAAASLLPPALVRLRERAPQVEPHLIEAEPARAQQLLAQDEVDLALVFTYAEHDATPPGLSSHAVAIDPVRLILPMDHPAAQKQVQTAALAASAWIAGCERCRGNLFSVTAKAGYEPRIRHSTDDYVVTQHLVAAGLGIALLPQAALDAFTHPAVHVHRSEGWGTRRIAALVRDGAAAVPAVGALLTCLLPVGHHRVHGSRRQPA